MSCIKQFSNSGFIQFLINKVLKGLRNGLFWLNTERDFLIFWLTRKHFWSFPHQTKKEAQQGKLILSFDVLGLEIAFAMENGKTVFANQNMLYDFVVFFFQFFVFR